MLRRFETNVGEYDLISIERHDLESDACATVADLFSIKTAGALRQVFYDTLDQRRLAATGTAGEKNFFGHNVRHLAAMVSK